MAEKKTDTAVLGGGCFWCLEAVFEQLRGVISVESGYAGGKEPNPTYKAVCGGTTGHAEVVRITFDPAVISFRDLLEVFFATHDPTTLNRQGNDVGTQYRSAIFCLTAEQLATATEFIAELGAANAFPNPIVTEIASGIRVLQGRGLSPGLLSRQPDAGLLPVRRQSKSCEDSQVICREAEVTLVSFLQ